MDYGKAKICIVNDKFTVAGGGGHYRILGIAKQLRRFGYDVTLCCPYFTTKSFDSFPSFSPINWYSMQYDNTLKLYRHLSKNIHLFDIVLVELPCPESKGLAVLYSKHKGKKTFVDIGDMWHSPYRLYRKLSHRFLKTVFKKSDKISVATHGLKNYLEKSLLIKKNIKYTPCGVDLGLFDPDKIKGIDLPIAYNKIILYQGSVSRFAGCHFLPSIGKEVLSNNKDVLFVIVGSGPYLKTLKQEVQKRGLSKSFIITGGVLHEHVPSYIAKADVCLALSPHSEQTNIGVFPMKIVEYMAMGKAVISTDINEVNNIIANGKEGIICSPLEISDKIVKLINDPNLCERLGKNARKKAVSKYSWEVIVRDLIKYWGI